MSAESPRPIDYTCRRAAEESTSRYRFELDGRPISPRIVSLTGASVPGEGDILYLSPAAMILGPPGHYRYFTDPADAGALWLEYGGGKRHLVALRVAAAPVDMREIAAADVVFKVGEPGTLDRPLAELRGLRGLALETWSPEIARTVAKLAGEQLIVTYEGSRDFGAAERPEFPAALPRDLRALRVELMLLGDLLGMSKKTDEGGPLPLAELPELPALRSLELDVRGSSSGSPDRIEAAALARFPKLQRLALDSFLKLQQPAELRALAHLAVLELAYQQTLGDLEFVRELPELRRLDVANTPVTSLAPLAGHPHLEVVIADAAPITALPDVPPPALQRLSIMSTRLADADVEAFAALSPQAQIDHRHNQSLAHRAACATRLHVRTGGTCHRRPEGEKTLFASDDPATVRELLPLLAVDEARSGFHCMCCGTLTFELYRDDALLAEVTLHHGKSLRHDGWPADAALAEPGPLCRWLAAHGAPQACAELAGAPE